jgi:hypothetical protein
MRNYQKAIKLNRNNRIFHESLEKAFISLKKQDGVLIYAIIKIQSMLIYAIIRIESCYYKTPSK